jgi:nuclear RNA export factor
MTTLQNFLVQRDAYLIAEEFVKTYFTIYDSFERQRLSQLYNDLSIFTLSNNFLVDRNQFANQPHDIFARIQSYAKLSRNIRIIVDMRKASENVWIGKDNIEQIFNQLAKTKHNFASFCIDVPHYESKKMILLTVSGTFQEEGHELASVRFLVGFTRTFVLRPSKDNKYLISNDQLFIHNPSINSSISISKYGNQSEIKEAVLEKQCLDLMPTELEEKEMKLILFQELTELKKDECTRQLEESFWDLKVALATFNTLMDSGDLLDHKFDFK